MNDTTRCPRCQKIVPADAPQGVCPACALAAAAETEPGADMPTPPAPAAAEPALSADELARRLPELESFELIGRGGMGSVYRAHHPQLDRLVAVKVIDSKLLAEPSFAERFTREARTLAQLSHPNVVAVYDFGHRDDLYYLVMEYVDGVNLRQTLRTGQVEPSEALTMVQNLCGALQYAHDKGIVHRDIKPENILIDRDGTLKIADFGLAKLIGGADPRLTRSEQIVGTPHYMAPEQIEKPEQVDHRADIYALGVVFYELLTGELPVGRFAPPSKKVKIDVRLDEVVLRTLEKEPARRYQQATELGSEVAALSTGDYLSTGEPQAVAGAAPRGYEYRSAANVMGLPLVHIAFSHDPAGKRMRVAQGVIAIGDVAVGGIAIGGLSFGGVTLGGISLGLFGFGGMVFGLLTALGGFAVGGFAAGGFAAGIFAQGALPMSVWALDGTALVRARIAGWLVATSALTLAVGGAIYAWAKSIAARNRQPG